ncbi:lysophospholipid acyltransferase family protein [Lactiplantibacillus fabifermentans]|uniref:Acyltransferase n=2 Tax=Lactiplantibacillus fabifermentans TaxID=483011 RepID=A0A0R2NMN6_9LACO|nr:hypothetical protein [Lactiplantibacillus fabifermentans]ETY74417.1 1-acyl-sn-glycerol-3-phosphate acyltransferase [Lactiplantibacillus fabifermentans T30PCM01]KRO26998.1 acyltransferase [Lactiplantibacillus fabifermentans DSM 21115]
MKWGKPRVYHYQNWQSDVVTSRQQNYQLPPNYQWPTAKYRQFMIRHLAGHLAWLYVKGWWRPRIIGRLPPQGAYVLYANHTQPTADVLLPLVVGGAQRFNALISPANLKVPIVGPWLPWAGGLALPATGRQLAQLTQLVTQRLQNQQFLMLYPESHVWPYYTQIRPFNVSAFHFPVASHVPAYVMTTTYQAPRHHRPQVTVFIDGPFWPDEQRPRKVQQHQLSQQVRTCMQHRAEASTYQYVQYEQQR